MKEFRSRPSVEASSDEGHISVYTEEDQSTLNEVLKITGTLLHVRQKLQL